LDLWYAFLQFWCQFLFAIFFSLRVYGRENIPGSGGVLIASNHQSFLDPILIGVGLKRQIHYMARRSLFQNAFFRWFIKSLNAFPVKREGMDVGAIKEAIALLRRGEVVLLFPEGTRTWDGTIGPIQRGFGMIARRAGVSLVPAVIDGALEAWPRTRRIFRFAPISVIFGKPLEPKEEALSEAVARSLAQLQQKIRSVKFRC